MSRAERGLGLLSTAIVMLWIGAYLAQLGHAASFPVAELAVAQAPVRPPPTPEAPTLPRPSPEDEPIDRNLAEAPPDKPEPVGTAALAKGRELLASGGAFPALNATYEDFDDFRQYAGSMLRLGARFVVVRNYRIVGAADIEAGILSEFQTAARFSPIPRDYSHEPALAQLSHSARDKYGSGSRIQMLLPRELDAGLFGGIAESLAARGEAPDSYTEIQGRYEPAPGDKVWFRVESGTRSDGASVPLSRLLDLSALAARA